MMKKKKGIHITASMVAAPDSSALNRAIRLRRFGGLTSLCGILISRPEFTVRNRTTIVFPKRGIRPNFVNSVTNGAYFRRHSARRVEPQHRRTTDWRMICSWQRVVHFLASTFRRTDSSPTWRKNPVAGLTCTTLGRFVFPRVQRKNLLLHVDIGFPKM